MGSGVASFVIFIFIFVAFISEAAHENAIKKDTDNFLSR
jgi:hypothetical protein